MKSFIETIISKVHLPLIDIFLNHLDQPLLFVIQNTLPYEIKKRF